MKKFTPYLRISSVEETQKDDITYLTIKGEIVPKVDPTVNFDDSMQKDLISQYKKNNDFVERIGKAVRKLSIDVMLANDKPNRANKLEGLKLVLIKKLVAYNKKYMFLQFTLKFKPTLKPVFEKNFKYQGLLLEEPLEKEKPKEDND